MIYLNKFSLNNKEESYYPFQIYSQKGLSELEFSNVTILYGNNGSGKTTLLNIISKTIKANERKENKTKSSLTDKNINEYVLGCVPSFENSDYSECKLILSEDIFNYIIFRRIRNEENEQKRKMLAEDNEYIRNRIKDDEEMSNGQTALMYFEENIKKDGLYILDEPENSLSPRYQMELIELIDEMSRYFNCQFIIATHSPLILALDGAKVYNLDITPVKTQNWYELDNVKLYYEFFKANKKLFESNN